ncbi:MAG: hypothetical protein Q8O89_02915, partial [Nanoarchaeota archaeon]|nr:hypothetical protein [Nanoarchaeota archaeon]
KVGKISGHKTKNANKEYFKSKIYLRNASDVNKRYELYDPGRVHLVEWRGYVKGKGILIFIPDTPRPKKEIRL